MASTDPALSLDWAPDAIIVTGRDGTILYANTRAEGLFGYRKEEIVERPLEMLLPEGLAGAAARTMPEAPLQRLSRTVPCVHRDGRRFSAGVRWRPAPAEQGECTVVSIREFEGDVADRSDAVRRQHELLALFSHDVRQSLQSIQFMCETIAGTAPETVSAISEIVRSAGALLDRVLRVSGSDEIETVSEPCDLGELLQTLARELEPLAKRKGLSLVVPGAANEITTDPILFRELLHNLLANAIRYTHDGHVEVTCTVRARSVRIEVLDTGVGIERGRLAALLESAASGAPLPNAGSGLGLGIAQRLATVLGCRLEAKSKPGAGSCFAVIAPRGRRRGAAPAKSRPRRGGRERG